MPRLVRKCTFLRLIQGMLTDTDKKIDRVTALSISAFANGMYGTAHSLRINSLGC
jgi:hypothetical protein